MPDMRQTILHALSVAAERFRDNAHVMRLNMNTCATQAKHLEWSRLAEQFDLQARETAAAHALLSEGFLCAFSTDGAAFQDGNAPWAVSGMLTDMAHTMRHDNVRGSVLCPNGNNVGFWSLDHADEGEEPDAEDVDDEDAD